MVHILLDVPELTAPWLFPALTPHLTPEKSVLVIAFAHSADLSASEWEEPYAKGSYRYGSIVEPLKAFGIPESQIDFLHPQDTPEAAAAKVRDADVLYFQGGMPDRMLERLTKLGVARQLREFEGIVMGYSAGALIQLGEYHLSPDGDYPEFVYRSGIPYLSGFYLEVHYEGTAVQDDAIRRVLQERKKPVFATALAKGALIVENGQLRPLGDVRVFLP